MSRAPGVREEEDEEEEKEEGVEVEIVEGRKGMTGGETNRDIGIWKHAHIHTQRTEEGGPC
jgi:hypothetical protein